MSRRGGGEGHASVVLHLGEGAVASCLVQSGQGGEGVVGVLITHHLLTGIV